MTERSLPQHPAPQPDLPPEPTSEESATRPIALALTVSILASIGLGVVYALGGQVQLEGVLLFLALGGIAVGFIVWGQELLPQGPYVQQRHPLGSGEAEQEEATETFEVGVESLERRRLLIRLLTGAFVALGAALVFPVRSLGAGPGGSLFRTAWRRGSRAVDENDRPVRPGDLDVGGVLTVFPAGANGSADSQTLLIKLGPGEYKPRRGREDWAVGRRRLLQGLPPRRLPGRALRTRHPQALLPLPPVGLRRARRRRAEERAGHPAAAAAAAGGRRRRVPRGPQRLHRAHRPRLLEPGPVRVERRS